MLTRAREIRLAVGAVVLMASGAALAQPVYTAQTRTARTAVVGAEETAVDLRSAVDFALFDATAYSEDRAWSAMATAEHTSTLGPAGIDCELITLPVDGLQIYGGRAESKLDVTFTVAALTAYSLSGTFDTNSGWSFSPVATAELTGPGGVMLFSQGHATPSDGWIGVFDAEGRLQPGEYRFVARAYSQAQRTGGADSARARLQLALGLEACPADANGDGLVDFADYLEFLNRYEAQDVRADLTADGLVDFADYLEFLNRYDAGC